MNGENSRSGRSLVITCATSARPRMPSTTSTSSGDLELVRSGTCAAARAWRRRSTSRITLPRRRRLSMVSNSRTRSSASSSISMSLSRSTRKKPPPLHSKPGNRRSEKRRISCSSRTKRGLVAGQADEALELARQQHEADERLAACRGRARWPTPMPRVGDERERVRRIDRDRRQDRDRLLVEALAQEVEIRPASARRRRARSTPCSRSRPVSSCQQRCWTRGQGRRRAA